MVAERDVEPTGSLARPEPRTAAMSKQQMIEAIQQKSRGATPEFLARFDEASLQLYLRRLTTVVGRRGRGSVWVREGHSPAIVTR